MTNLITLTDLDGDPIALPADSIVLVVKPDLAPGGIITGARAKILTNTGWTIEVRESVADIVAAVNKTVGSLRH